MKKYNTTDIQQLDHLSQIRLRPGMYIGDCQTPTKLLVECLDNALDEVQNGHANKIFISINNETGEFIVADNGRGIPFDYKLSPLEDPPILICNSLFTSGKYKKDTDESAYSVASGLHGVGMTVCNALSEYIKIDIFKNKKHASYLLKYDDEPIRFPIKEKLTSKFSTIFTVKPHKKHFDSLTINYNVIKERLIIAASNFADLHIVLDIDGKLENIKGSENNLIELYLGKNIKEWHTFESKNPDKTKVKEQCIVKIAWDFDSSSTKMDTFTTVNLVKVDSGAHVNYVTTIIENIFQKFAKKNKYEFNPSDALNWIKIYINLKIINTEFESQTKEKLSKKTDLTVMNQLESKIESYFKKYENLNDLLERFDYYRKSIQNKKVMKFNVSNKRGMTYLTKLRDCTMPGGELLIGEGDSAVGSLVKLRDPKKHAILPLKGVTVNATKKRLSELLENDVVSNIVKAIGCGITPSCDVSKLRYSKIILAADPDPAGEFITALLITLFAKLTPEIIKGKFLYLCNTPLFGYGLNEKFVPLWTDEDVSKAREQGKTVRRFKGLGEFNEIELKNITLDEKTRHLDIVHWDDDMAKKLFKVMSDSKLKYDLVMNQYDY